MPETKIDPDAAMEYSRKRAKEGISDVEHGYPLFEKNNAALHHSALVEAAQGLADEMAEWVRDGVNGEEIESGDVIYDCGYCGSSSAEWRNISHEDTCSVGRATKALLTLEALLPTKEG